MTERPILFSGPMVKAILDGRKTQTRRIVKPQPEPGTDCPYHIGDSENRTARKLPYGKPGDRLWIRETWKQAIREGAEVIRYRADDSWKRKWPNGYEKGYGQNWKPSIHMPRWASRMSLDVTGVKIERLQDITEHGAVLEGVGWTDDGYIPAFRDLWDDLNAERGFGWDKNPWVWVVTFAPVQTGRDDA